MPRQKGLWSRLYTVLPNFIVGAQLNGQSWTKEPCARDVARLILIPMKDYASIL